MIADERRSFGLLFGATGERTGCPPEDRAMMRSPLQVKGVPDIAVEEALWLAPPR